MIFKTCKLYKLQTAFDEFGNGTNECQLVSDIEVSLSISKMAAVENGVVYYTYETVGITPFNDLDPKESYKLLDGTDEYTVIAILPARLNVLKLKRVI